MSNVIAFTPRPRALLPPAMPPLTGIGLRAHLEEAAQTALDAADKIIAALDRIEDTGDGTAPLMTAIAAPAGEAIPPAEGELCNRYRAGAREADPEPKLDPGAAVREAALAEPEASESDLAEIAPTEPVYKPIRLPWRGAGNVVSAAGCAVLALVIGG